MSTSEEPDRSIQCLYELLRRSSASDARSTLDVFLRDTESRRKKAVKHALDVWRIVIGNYDDVMQQTICHVSERWLSGDLTFKDEGLSAFDGWVGTLWDHEASKACRRLHLQDNHGIVTVDAETLDERAGLSDDERPRALAIAAIEELDDPSLEEILFDDIDGWTIEESAMRRGRSKSEVARMRDEGRDRLRERFRGKENGS